MPNRVVLCVLLATPAFAATIPVTTTSEWRAAVNAADPGDEIVLADGTYDLTTSVDANRDGTLSQPIVVRAQNPLGALIRVDTQVGIRVSGRHWHFAGLHFEGVCASDDTCEHALQVSGDAQGFVLRDSRLVDFNAQVKVNAAPNGTAWDIPHDGLIERNAFYDTRVRNTGNPVTKINVDTGDRWVVRDNLIADFHKGGGNQISYGAFMKSGGAGGVFERNLVLCTRDVTSSGVLIGLSFGGGGTDPRFCAPAFDANAPCDPEHTGGILRNNVIANCSDVGVYLNRAAGTKVLFNTLVGTTGIDFRFESTTGEAHGNVLSGSIRERNDATFTAGTNLLQIPTGTFADWYEAPLAGDLDVVGDVSQLLAAAQPHPDVPDDFCGRTRPTAGGTTLGALEHAHGDCAVWPPEPRSLPDAGQQGPDAGAPEADGGKTGSDGGVQPDLDGGSGAGTTAGEGCGCSAGSGGGAGGLVLLMAALLRRRYASPTARRTFSMMGRA